MQAGNQTQGKDDEKMQAGNQTQASDPNTISNTHKEKQEQDKGKNSHMQVQQIKDTQKEKKHAGNRYECKC